jgi:methylaspartate mutase S subunit
VTNVQPGPKGTFVCGVLNDIHSLGLFILMQALRRNGHHVVNLGTMVPPEDFVAAARETAAHALIASNSSGMGELEVERLVDACREAGLGHVLIYAGGMLTLQKEDTLETKRRLEASGVRHVFPPGTSLKDSLAVFEADLAVPRKKISRPRS